MKVSLDMLMNSSVNFNNAEEVVDYGEFSFTQAELPVMKFIILKKREVYQAICIDVEIDAVGNSLQGARKNLENTLNSYVIQMIYNYDGNEKAAIEDIANTAFSKGSLKSRLFSRYNQANQQRIMNKSLKKAT